ncbi:MAG: hypothetical protein IPG82_22055 [Saprospiraceae bacterium]|nr:hypothetical protein [Saprospiraceae bacterium]
MPLPVGESIPIKYTGENQNFFDDVLVGEVWICSVNRIWNGLLKNTNSAELAILTANALNIRLIHGA